MNSIPGSGRSPGEGHDNPLQFSCLETLTDRGAWQATEGGGGALVNFTDWGLKYLHLGVGSKN